jgi:hypothetical protein
MSLGDLQTARESSLSRTLTSEGLGHVVKALNASMRSPLTKDGSESAPVLMEVGSHSHELCSFTH